MKPLGLPKLLDELEAAYGRQHATWPTEPYRFLVWWLCGYPASDASCDKGWRQLNASVGIEPQKILEAPPQKLAAALKAGGMVPELRAQRLKEVAARVQDQLCGDLDRALRGPLDPARKLLKRFPNIADPGADRILLFGKLAPVAAVPSNCPHVLVRIERGAERENYGRTYREAQESIAAQTPPTFPARMRAYLLLKRHGQQTCKRTKPKCPECAVREHCAYAAGKMRGGIGARG